MTVFATGLLMLMGGLIYLSWGTNDPVLLPYTPQGTYLPIAHIGGVPVRVYIADTPEEQQKGLSVFNRLPPGTGMLFVFDQDDTYGIWMKDMKFAIDIIWIDAEGRIIDIVQHATPESFPQVFTPRAPARYVLETRSGFVEERNVNASDLVDLADVL